MRGRRLFVMSGLYGVFAVLILMPHGNTLAGQGAPGAARELIARGEYLVTAGGCHDCHTPKIFTGKGPEPDMSRSMAGAPASLKLPQVPPGLISPDGWGALTTNDMTAWVGPWGVSFAANLTPDKATGMGSWTEAAFVRSMRTGKHKGVLREILPPMPWQNLSRLNDEDLKAVFAYLQSLKPIQNKVPDPIPTKR
jgi:mono/diheme cytochrome c family protein